MSVVYKTSMTCKEHYIQSASRYKSKLHTKGMAEDIYFFFKAAQRGCEMWNVH